MSENLILKLNELFIKDIYTFIIKSIFKYNSYHFYKIVINIKAFKYLIVNFDQFQAL